MNTVEGLAERAATIAQVMVPRLIEPVLPAEDEHHLKKVLRIRDNERVSVIDGKGSWAICTWTDAVGLRRASDIYVQDPPAASIEVAFAPLKGDRTELVVQKLTELGVDCIQLLDTDRTIVKWKGAKLEKGLERIGKIAREASMQSRRVTIPVVAAPISVSEAVEMGFCLTTWGSEPLSAQHPKVAVGPEGGWTPAELALCPSPVSLGGNVLRAETAAIAAGAILAAARV